MKLIATWKLSQETETEEPIRVRWEDGSAATMEDFARIVPASQSDPYIEGNIVEFGYDTRNQKEA
jgi:hypothetical protein